MPQTILNSRRNCLRAQTGRLHLIRRKKCAPSENASSRKNGVKIQPDLGRPRHFRHRDLPGLRSFPVEHPFENLLIFYRANDETLDAIRLMHGARDLPRRLREPPED
jgi:hypothetical protein